MKKLSSPTSVPEKPIFRGYDIEDTCSYSGYRRNLPHFRVPGATYFVTFRTNDSIPKAVLQQWLHERNEWLKKYEIDPVWSDTDPKRKFKAYFSIPEPERLAFETRQRNRFFIELNKCHGSCLLAESCANDIVAKSLENFHGQRIWLGDYVVMPNHVHVLVQPFPGVKLEEWLYSIKRFTSNQIGRLNLGVNTDNDVTNQKAFWRSEAFDRIIRSMEELVRIRHYILNNPKKHKPGTYFVKQMDWLDEYENNWLAFMTARRAPSQPTTEVTRHPTPAPK
jgi:putative transposase